MRYLIHMEEAMDTEAKTENKDRAHVAISPTAATQLDMLVARALQAGQRPAGRRACRASIIEELAANALKTPCAGEIEGQ